MSTIERRRPLAVLALVGVLAFGACGGSGDDDAAQAPVAQLITAGRPEVGGQAPTFAVTTLDGDRFRFPTGKPAAVFFTAASCSSCLEMAKSLGQVKKRAGEGLDILGVDIDPAGSPAAFRHWISTAGDPPLRFARDDGGTLASAYEVTGLSTVLVTDAAGRVVLRSLSAGAAEVERALAQAEG